MKSNKHIVIITPGFPADEKDFLTIPPLQEFLKSLKSSFPFLIITIIALHYPYQTRKYNWNQLHIISLGGKNNTLMKPFLWYKTISKIKKIHKSNKVNLIHSLWLGECAIIGNILSRKFKCKHVCTLMGQDVKPSNKYFRLMKYKNVTIVAISKNQSDQFFQLTTRNVDEIIPWGIDNIQFDSRERDIDLLAVGSLIPLKNYSLLIELVEKISEVHPHVKCILAGSGPEELRLKQLAKEKGLEENISFTGTKNRSEIFKLMQRSKIFIHPSMFEGFGYVFAEALVNGMNIVSFNVGYAQKHPKWFIASVEEDFINITLNLLSSKLDFTPVNLFPLAETVKWYASLYEIN